MKKLILCLLCTLFVFSGCSTTKQTHKVIFQENISIEYMKNVNTAKYVKRVDSFLIDESMIEDNKINVSNFSVICPDVKTETLGETTLIYLIGNEKYSVEAKIVDTTKPTIKADEKYVFEVGELQDFDKKFSVSDNFDKKDDIAIEIKGLKDIDPNKTGTYDIEIIATDTSDNQSKKKVQITIKDSKKEAEEKRKKELEEQKKQEQIQQSQNTNVNNSVGGSQNSSGQSSAPQQTQPPVHTPSYSSKDFLFSQGYDMNSAPSACQSELLASGQAGACTPIQDASGIYIGMRLTFY